MFNPPRRGWLSFIVAILLTAAAVLPSQAQLVGTPVNTGAQLGTTTPFGFGMNGTTYTPQQLAYMQQLSMVNPYAQAAFANTLQSNPALFYQGQQSPFAGSLFQTTNGFTPGAMNNSTGDLSRFGNSVGGMPGWEEGWFPWSHHEEWRRREERRREEWRRHEEWRHHDQSTSSANSSANSTTSSSTGTTGSDKASSHVGHHVGDRTRANSDSSTAKASVSITDQDGKITVKASAQSGDSKATAKAVFNASSSSTNSSNQVAGSTVGHHHHSTASNTTNTTNSSSTTNSATTASSTKQTSGSQTSSTKSNTSTASSTPTTTTNATTTASSKHSSTATTNPTTATSSSTQHQHCATQTGTVTAHASARASGGTATARASATTNRAASFATAGRQTGGQVGHQFAQSGGFNRATAGRGRR